MVYQTTLYRGYLQKYDLSPKIPQTQGNVKSESA